MGCGEGAPQLDTSQVTNPEGRLGVCESCQKAIDEVTEKNFLIVRGNRYIVCDEKCGADLKDWLAKQ
jgi:hypothetical protein